MQSLNNSHLLSKLWQYHWESEPSTLSSMKMWKLLILFKCLGISYNPSPNARIALGMDAFIWKPQVVSKALQKSMELEFQWSWSVPPNAKVWIDCEEERLFWDSSFKTKRYQFSSRPKLPYSPTSCKRNVKVIVNKRGIEASPHLPIPSPSPALLLHVDKPGDLAIGEFYLYLMTSPYLQDRLYFPFIRDSPSKSLSVVPTYPCIFMYTW